MIFKQEAIPPFLTPPRLSLAWQKSYGPRDDLVPRSATQCGGGGLGRSLEGGSKGEMG